MQFFFTWTDMNITFSMNFTNNAISHLYCFMDGLIQIKKASKFVVIWLLQPLSKNQTFGEDIVVE